MVKSYETLVDSDTKVDVNTGIVAAGRLQSLIDSRDYGHESLVMKVQMGQICAAVKSTVPQEMWAAIVEKLEELEQHPESLDVGEDAFDDLTTTPTTRPSSSTTTTSFDLRSACRHRGRWGPLPVWTGRSRSRRCWPSRHSMCAGDGGFVTPSLTGRRQHHSPQSISCRFRPRGLSMGHPLL